jgi:hypothetical protein
VRFSLKWILAGMVYVAIAATAVARGQWYLADLALALTFAMLSFVALMAIYTRGKRQACALGFLVGCAYFLGYLEFSSQSSLTFRWLRACGLDNSGPMTPPAALSADDPFGAPTPQIVQPDPQTAVEQLDARLRAANAVATLAFGLTGSLVGLMAFRASAVEARG